MQQSPLPGQVPTASTTGGVPAKTAVNQSAAQSATLADPIVCLLVTLFSPADPTAIQPPSSL